MTIEEIAYKVRLHYFEGFIDEYSMHKRKILTDNNQFRIVSDYNAKNDFRKNHCEKINFFRFFS